VEVDRKEGVLMRGGSLWKTYQKGNTEGEPGILSQEKNERKRRINVGRERQIRRTIIFVKKEGVAKKGGKWGLVLNK